MLVLSDYRGKKSLFPQFTVRKKTPEGVLSLNSKRKIKNACRWMVAAATWKTVYEKKLKKKVKWKINFVTLTFHENMLNDNLARKLLSQWLEMAKHRFELHLYVWVAEPQERGAIHFHIATDTYMPYKEIQYTWNRLLKKHNLNSITDNSTDVHAVIGIKHIENYITDYLTNESKHEGRRKIKGKLWGCSHLLSQAGKEFLLIDEEDVNELQNDEIQNSLYAKYLSEGKEIPEFLKFIDVYLTGEQYYNRLTECNLKKLYENEITKLRHKKRQLQLFPPYHPFGAATQPLGN